MVHSFPCAQYIRSSSSLLHRYQPVVVAIAGMGKAEAPTSSEALPSRPQHTLEALPQGTGVLHKPVKAAEPWAATAVAPVTDDLTFFLRLQAGAPATAPATAPAVPAPPRC